MTGGKVMAPRKALRGVERASSAPIKPVSSKGMRFPRPKNGSARRLRVQDSWAALEKQASLPAEEERTVTHVETEGDDDVEMIEISLVPGVASPVPSTPGAKKPSPPASAPRSASDEEQLEILLDSARVGDLVAFRRACAALLDRNVRLDTPGAMGWTAAHWAARDGHLHVLEHLARLEVNLDVLDRRGDSLLHKAAANGQYRMCQWLLDRGFNVQARNNLGRSPLDAAQERSALHRSSDAELCEAILARAYATTF